MYCSHCGTDIPDGAGFCPGCGRQVTTGAQMSSTQPRSTSYGNMDFSAVTEKARGRKMPTGVKVLLWVVFAIILLSILRVNKSNTVTTKPELTKEEYIAQCIDVDYEAVARHPNDFKGEKITFSGKVVQVSEGSYVTLRINQGGDYDATWYVRYTPTENEGRILENDTIVVYGECTGTKTYTAVLGNNVTIPSMSMMYYTIDGK